MADERYTNAFVRDSKEVVREVDGKKVTFVRFRAVAKCKVPNPDYVPKPEGEDTRTAKQKRRDVWQQVSTNLEARKGRSKKQTDTNVTNALETWRAELNAEASVPEKALTSVADYARDYISLRERVQVDGKGVLEKSTALDYRKSLGRLAANGFDSISMHDVTTKFVREWERTRLEKGMSVYQVRKCHRLLHLVFDYAYRMEELEANPIARVTPPSLPKKKPNSLTQEGMQFVTEQLEGLEPTPVVVAAYLGLHAGLRCEEACALRWSDVDFERQTLAVRGAVGVGKGGSYMKDTKTGKTRIVDFDSPQMASLLKKRQRLMLEQRGNIITGLNDSFVCGNVDGGYAHPTTISRQWAALANAWGLKGVSGERINFHALRHSFVTAQLESGSAPQDVADNAGHSSTQMTVDTYAAALRKGKKRAAEKSGAYMRPKEEASVIQFPSTGTEG